MNSYFYIHTPTTNTDALYRTILSSGLPADVSYFMRCGVDKVLLKPLDIDFFLHTMTVYQNESKNDQIKEMRKEIEREWGRYIGRG